MQALRHGSVLVRAAGLRLMGVADAAAFASLHTTLRSRIWQQTSCALQHDPAASVRAAAAKAVGNLADIPSFVRLIGRTILATK